jgi:phosphoribosyl 1,2-cyclic phosphodiesterase
MTQKTHVCVLASTSSGNCTVIWNDRISILVDCGVGVTYTSEVLATLGLSLSQLSAVFITHCHGDHVNRYTLKNIVDYRVPIYCHATVAKVLKRIHPILHEKIGSLVAYTEGKNVCDGLSFSPFSVPHDSDGGCFGYSFFMESSTATHKISIATDIGFTEPGLAVRFANSDIIIIESNHDVRMLTESPRPQWLKDRIVKTGHLSNDQCSDFMQEVLAASTNFPAAIVLAHISQECNTNSHAKTSMHTMLSIAKKQHIAIVETFKEKPSAVVSV